MLILVSALLLTGIAMASEELSMLSTVPLVSLTYFALAGLIHFFIGWTLLSVSQKRIGAARTSALVGTTPLFAGFIAALAFSELLSLSTLLGVILIVVGVYYVSNAEVVESSVEVRDAREQIHRGWRAASFGLGTAVCWSLSPIFIRLGLDGLPSPIVGVAIGMIATALAYSAALFVRLRRLQPDPIRQRLLLLQLGAGVLVGLSTWARWMALDLAPVAVALALGRLSVPLVLVLSPVLIGQKLEQVTARVWFGGMVIVAGSLLLVFFE